jgi:hypothetical protein
MFSYFGGRNNLLMQKISVLFFVVFAAFTSCRAPQALLKQDAKIETLNLALDLKIVQPYEYRQAIEQKMAKFVEVYNSESHPFKLALNNGQTNSTCSLQVVRVKFVSKGQSHLGLGVSVVGVGLFTTLIATGFPVPLGWVYIPNARTTLEPTMSYDISDITKRNRVGFMTVGMYRKQEKQIDIQSTKFVKYAVSMVQTIEEDYNKKRNQQ